MNRTTQPSYSLSPDNWRPIQRWETLRIGEVVEVWADGSALFYGYVDELTEDAQIVWIVEHGIGARRLFLHSESTLYRPANGLGHLIPYA